MKGKRIWFKPTNIWQLNHLGHTKFAWCDFINNRSEGMGLPANEVELVANWKINYKPFIQIIAFKLKMLFT